MKIERAKICPYCGKTGGDFNDEHLIPQCLTKPHTKRRPPDFECHVECNNSKSKFDEMLCDILKLTVRSDQIQEREISNMLKGRNSELSNIINMHAENINYPIVEINMDIFARFVYIYGDYLARGWYFILKGRILNKNRYLVYTEYDNQFDSGYLKRTIPSEGRDCFHDLEKNEKTKLIAPGKAMVYTETIFHYMFVFDHTFIMRTQILKNTNTNKRKILRKISDFLGIPSAYDP